MMPLPGKSNGKRLTPTAALMTITGSSAPIKAYPIVCGRNGCRDGMPATKFRTGVPFNLYQHHFAARGWYVGYTPQEDRCPRCLEAEKQQRRAAKAKPPAPTITPPSPAPASTIVPLHAPQPQYHFGPTTSELKRLQAKFNQPPAAPHTTPQDEVALLNRRVRQLEAEVKSLRGTLTEEVASLRMMLEQAPAPRTRSLQRAVKQG